MVTVRKSPDKTNPLTPGVVFSLVSASDKEIVFGFGQTFDRCAFQVVFIFVELLQCRSEAGVIGQFEDNVFFARRVVVVFIFAVDDENEAFVVGTVESCGIAGKVVLAVEEIFGRNILGGSSFCIEIHIRGSTVIGSAEGCFRQISDQFDGFCVQFLFALIGQFVRVFAFGLMRPVPS